MLGLRPSLHCHNEIRQAPPLYGRVPPRLRALAGRGGALSRLLRRVAISHARLLLRLSLLATLCGVGGAILARASTTMILATSSLGTTDVQSPRHCLHDHGMCIVGCPRRSLGGSVQSFWPIAKGTSECVALALMLTHCSHAVLVNIQHLSLPRILGRQQSSVDRHSC